MGAVESEAPEPREKRYRVSGSQAVFGAAPGETFVRVIAPEHEARLLASGAITEVGAKKAAGDKKATSAASDKE